MGQNSSTDQSNTRVYIRNERPRPANDNRRPGDSKRITGQMTRINPQGPKDRRPRQDGQQ